MCSLVNFEVLRPGEDLPAVGVGTGEGPLASVYPDVVYEFVLGFEGPSRPRAVLPEAGVRRNLGTTDVLHREMRHYLVDAVEGLAADLARAGHPDVLLDPPAGHLLSLITAPSADSNAWVAAGCDARHAGRTGCAATAVPQVPHESPSVWVTGPRSVRADHSRMLLGVHGASEVRVIHTQVLVVVRRRWHHLARIVPRVVLVHSRVLGILHETRARRAGLVVAQWREETQAGLGRRRI